MKVHVLNWIKASIFVKTYLTIDRKVDIMIVTEYKNVGAVVRIHDDFFETKTEQHISHLSRVTSESYKRRQIERNVLPTSTPIKQAEQA